MSSRRPPSQRNAEYAQQRHGRQLQSMTPGTAGGRLASAAPVRVGSDVLAAVEPGLDGSAGIVFAYDTFALTGAAPTLTLSYVPTDGSLHVYLNGLEQHEGTDYTLSGLTLTVLASMDTSSGDTLDARYAYISDQAAVISAVPSSYSTAFGYGESAPTGGNGSFTTSLTFVAGDLLVMAYNSLDGNGTPPAGFALLESSTDLLKVWAKVAASDTDDLTVSGITNEWALIGFSFAGSTVNQHAVGSPVTASSPPVAAATPSLTSVADGYALHLWGARGSYSATRITVPSALSGITAGSASNIAVGGGLEVTSASTSTTRTAQAFCTASTITCVGAQLIVTQG